MAEPLIHVRHLYRRFQSGDKIIDVLKDINLDIYAGEMVAIIGASGSGKSTLMNILGCLDRPSQGQYLIENTNTANMNSGERARLRREYIGFIFQRYHLIPDLNARENVALPAIYVGTPGATRLKRADTLLNRLGLEERCYYHPNQLSGGQQQRVSIARALMNGGKIIFADEPTGALDSQSGMEVMAILKALHAEGYTVVIVTHDPQIAAHTERIIELKDGEIIRDNYQVHQNNEQNLSPTNTQLAANPPIKRYDFGVGRLLSAFNMAIRSIAGHKLRTFLTMLGIIIGIASVVSVVALGEGSQAKILEDISNLGTNTITIFRGAPGDNHFFRIRTLTQEDAQILARQSFVHSASPQVGHNATLRYANKEFNADISGIGADYFQVQNLKPVAGRLFNDNEVKNYATVAVIDQSGAKTIFGNQPAIGAVILLNNMPIRIIGIVDNSKDRDMNNNQINVWTPYTTVMNRLLGQNYIEAISVRINENIESATAEDAIKRILIRRHGSEDFTLFNSDSIRKLIEETVATLTLLVSAIALISLIVGGIGVMNIMLVSVTERTQEIGIRMAIGARQNDILRQFLIEAVLLCLIGGLLGIGLAFAIGYLFSLTNNDFKMIYSATAIVTAFSSATLIGVIFGFLPARNAAKLDPVVALSRE